MCNVHVNLVGEWLCISAVMQGVILQRWLVCARKHAPATKITSKKWMLGLVRMQRPEYSARVADNALLLLLEGCKFGSVPGWGGARITMLHCVTALRALIKNVEVRRWDVKEQLMG